MNDPNCPDTMPTNETVGEQPTNRSRWAWLLWLLLVSVASMSIFGNDGPAAAWSWLAILASAAVVLALLIWHKRRTSSGRPDRPDASPAARTPAERRAATEARWAQGAEAARRERAEQAAEYERTAEQRRREAAERREAEAAGR